MDAKEYIYENFIHKYRYVENDGKDCFKIIESEKDRQAPITDKYTYLDEGDKYFVIWCRRGHLIKACEDDIEDLEKNGCPFCKTHRTNQYDWQRHIDYSVELDSLGFAADSLKSIFEKYKGVILTTVDDIEQDFNINSIPVNKIEKILDVPMAVLEFKQRRKQDRLDLIELADLKYNLWSKVGDNQLCIKRLIPLFENMKNRFSEFKPDERDWFITKCRKCRKISLFSALKADMDNGICEGCGRELLPHKKWFNYSYEKYLDRNEEGFSTASFIQKKQGKGGRI